MKSEKKTGAILSYLSTILNTCVTIFLTPFILSKIGDAEYGVYRTVQSLTGQLALISIGIGTIMSVMIARYNASNSPSKKEDTENLLATGISIALVIPLIVIVVGFVLLMFVDDLYANTMTSQQIDLVKKLYIVLLFNVALYLFRDVFVGIVNGYEKFIYSNGIKVARIILRVVIIVGLLEAGFKSLALVVCDLSITIIVLICDVCYCIGKLKIRPRFHYFDKKLFRTIFSFSVAIILQTIVNQVNQNLDGVILGAMVLPELVTVYSLALSIYVAFNSLSSSIASLFTPEAARLVENKSSTETLQAFTEKVGRYQFLTEALMLGGFIAVGTNFVQIWVGSGKEDVYYLTLILMIPMTFANTLSGANNILDGYMKRMGRSIILIITAALNVLTSILMIRVIGYWGAAFGTAWSVIVGQVFLLSIHYKNVFGFRLSHFFKGVLKGILPSLIIALACSLAFNFLPISSDVIMFLIKGVVFVGVYFACLLLFGANKNERETMLGAIRGVLKKLKMRRA